MGESEENFSPEEIHNITIKKLDSDRFKVTFGAETGIPNLYSASTEVELDRDLLKQFIESAQEALNL